MNGGRQQKVKKIQGERTKLQVAYTVVMTDYGLNDSINIFPTDGTDIKRLHSTFAF